MFWNKVRKADDTIRGIKIERYVASWYNAGGKPSKSAISKWLKSLTFVDDEPLSDEEIDIIATKATMGKYELEVLAREFV